MILKLSGVPGTPCHGQGPKAGRGQKEESMMGQESRWGLQPS